MQKHKNIFQWLLDKLREFVGNLKQYYNTIGKNPSAEANALKEQVGDTVKYMDSIVKLFDQAAVQAVENYQKTAGTETQKNTTGDGGVQYSFIGRSADGSGIYKTNYPLNTPKAVKQADLIKLIQDVWSSKPITLTIVENGRYVDITAKFNPELKERSDLAKIAFGNKKGNAAEQRMTLDLASDLYQIASEARFNYSKDATAKPNNPAHDGVTKYHYFLTNLVYKNNNGNYIQCHMNIDVKRNAEGDWFYSFAIEKGSVPQTLLAAVTENSATLPNDTIANTGDIVKNESARAMDLEVDAQTESVAPTVQNQQRTNTLTDRDVLAVAASEVDTGKWTDAEKEALRIFSRRLKALEDLQTQRAELGRSYYEQQFGPGGDRQAASKTLNRMHVLDEQISRAAAEVLDVEHKEVLRKVLKKARSVVEQQNREQFQASVHQRENFSLDNPYHKYLAGCTNRHSLLFPGLFQIKFSL